MVFPLCHQRPADWSGEWYRIHHDPVKATILRTSILLPSKDLSLICNLENKTNEEQLRTLMVDCSRSGNNQSRVCICFEDIDLKLIESH